VVVTLRRWHLLTARRGQHPVMQKKSESVGELTYRSIFLRANKHAGRREDGRNELLEMVDTNVDRLGSADAGQRVVLQFVERTLAAERRF
jgi:hypothetical protein